MPCNRSLGEGCLVWGVHGPGGLLWGVPGQGVCSGGCLVCGVPGPGGLLRGGTWSGGAGIPACTEADPPERQLLMRTVRIPLECILVHAHFGINL